MTTSEWVWQLKWVHWWLILITVITNMYNYYNDDIRAIDKNGYSYCNDYNDFYFNDCTRAASVTVLILISCLLCWMPASISHLLICPKVWFFLKWCCSWWWWWSSSSWQFVWWWFQGCKFSHSDLNPVEGFLLHTICNSLVILKSIFNSVVFALRHNQVLWRWWWLWWQWWWWW